MRSQGGGGGGELEQLLDAFGSASATANKGLRGGGRESLKHIHNAFSKPKLNGHQHQGKPIKIHRNQSITAKSMIINQNQSQ